MAALLLPATALGDELPSSQPDGQLIWSSVTGGDYHDPNNWTEVAPPTSGAPEADDAVSINLGPGTAPLPTPITFSSDGEGFSLFHGSGHVTFDLGGKDLTFGEEIVVSPVTTDDAPALTVTDSSQSGPSQLSSKTTFVANGGALHLSDVDVLTTDTASIGVSDDRFWIAPTPSTATLDNGSWSIGTRLDVGASGDGTLTVTGGTLSVTGNAFGDGVYLGAGDGVTGELHVTGADAMIDGRNHVVGGNGIGVLTVDGDASLTGRTVWIGTGATGNGTLTVGGPGNDGGSIDVSNLLLGLSSSLSSGGAGTLSIQGTSEVTTGALRAGGNATLDFQGGTLTVTDTIRGFGFGPLTIGNGIDAARLDHSGSLSNLGDVSVANDAVVDQSGRLSVDALSVQDGGTFNQDGGSLSVESLSTSGSGAFHWNGGALGYRSGDVTVGQGEPIPAELVLSETGRTALSVQSGTLTIDGDQSLDPGSAGGSVTLQNGGSLSAERIERVDGGTFDYQGGALHLTGIGVGDGLVVGSAGLVAPGTTLSVGDRLDVARAILVEAGAVLTQDGGSVHAADISAQETGRFDYQSGDLFVDGPAGIHVGSGGVTGDAGSLDVVIDGAWRTDALRATVVGDGASLTLQDGSLLDTGSIDHLADSNGFHFDGGTLRIQNQIDVGGTGAGIEGPLTLTASHHLDVRAPADDALHISDHALRVEGGTLTTRGGFDVDSASGGRLYYSSGQASFGSSVVVGDVESIASTTIGLASGDSFSASDITFASGARAELTGGSLAAGTLSGAAGSVQFTSGSVFTSSNLTVGDGGLVSGVGGGAVTLDGADLIRAEEVKLTSNLAMDGGRLQVATFDTNGHEFDWSGGTVNVFDQDVYIGSGFTEVFTESVGGLKLAGNALSDEYLTLDSDMVLDVGRKTFVDASGLRIQDGGRLSTYELSAGQDQMHVTVDEGGELFVSHLAVDTPILVEGQVVAENIEIASTLTLSDSANLDWPRFGGHMRSYESAVGVCHGEAKASSVYE